MNLILRYLIRNVAEKKGRTALIVPSVTSDGQILRSGGEWSDFSLQGYSLDDFNLMFSPE